MSSREWEGLGRGFGDLVCTPGVDGACSIGLDVCKLFIRGVEDLVDSFFISVVYIIHENLSILLQIPR